MKILWVKTDYLHPTNRGGQIRTLETVRRLHQRHELHYVTFEDPASPEGPARASEYSARHFAVPHEVPAKRLTSPAFLGQLAAGLVSPLPVSVLRWRSSRMKDKIRELEAAHQYDAVVCDFLFPAPNVPNLPRAVLFQHNVEARIWRRHAEHAGDPLRRAYFGLQASRMTAYERSVCQQVRRVIAVSESDARQMREEYGIGEVHAVDTGVDVDYFTPPPAPEQPPSADLVFLGSMDWMPNIDGIQWFMRAIWPDIVRQRPETTLAIVGRQPGPGILALAGPNVRVTGTVPDVRPWLWGGRLSIVPLQVGGGTRLKIYESMAAGLPVLSTTIGAEGLEVRDGFNIAIADEPAAFAARCLELLAQPGQRASLAGQAASMVRDKYSWESVTRQFEGLLAPA